MSAHLIYYDAVAQQIVVREISNEEFYVSADDSKAKRAALTNDASIEYIARRHGLSVDVVRNAAGEMLRPDGMIEYKPTEYTKITGAISDLRMLVEMATR